MTKIAAVILALAVPGAAHAYGYLTGCSGTEAYTSINHRLAIACAPGGSSPIRSLAGTTNNSLAAEFGWRAWWELNYANPHIWIDVAGQCVNPNGTVESSATATPNLASLNATIGVFGRTFRDSSTYDCGTLGLGGSDLRQFDMAVNPISATTGSAIPLFSQSCRTPTFTMNGTWIHELGHAYGQDHFDSWISTMNTLSPDVSNCRRGKVGQTSKVVWIQRPSSDAQQGHGYKYPLPAAKDVGAISLVQTGPLSPTTQPGVPTRELFMPRDGITFPAAITWTYMNNRDEYGASIPYKIYTVAEDGNLEPIWSTKIVVGTGSFSSSAAGAIFPVTRSISIPVAWHTIGTRFRLYVVMDPDNAVPEFDDTDNAVDLNVTVVRSQANF